MLSAAQAAKRAVPFLLFAAVATGAVTGAYFAFSHFLQDRQSALYSPRRTWEVPVGRRVTEKAGGKAEGKNGTRSNDIPGHTAAEAGQAAIQRQLKTLEDINAVNEMNRRLMEQQRQMQKQR